MDYLIVYHAKFYYGLCVLYDIDMDTLESLRPNINFEEICCFKAKEYTIHRGILYSSVLDKMLSHKNEYFFRDDPTEHHLDLIPNIFDWYREYKGKYVEVYVEPKDRFISLDENKFRVFNQELKEIKKDEERLYYLG